MIRRLTSGVLPVQFDLIAKVKAGAKNRKTYH
jgi:hypothetical protein